MSSAGHLLREGGVTLVELVMSIVVIGIGLAGILVVINRNVLSSADPMVQHQAVAIAEAYLEEILTKDFCEPGNTCTPGTSNNPSPGATCQICGVVEARALRNSVCDYNGLADSPPRDQDNNVIAGLGGYAVNVAVGQTDTDGAVLGTLRGDLCQVLRADVTVSGPAGVSFTLSGFRTNYQ